MSRYRVKRTTWLGKSLTDARIEAGLTIEQVAKKTGVSSTLISGYERGVIDPRLKSLEKIVAALGHEVDILKK